MLQENDQLELTKREQEEARRLIKARFAKDIARAKSLLAKIESDEPSLDREERVERARAVRDMWLALERDRLAQFERKLQRNARGGAVVVVGDLRSALDRMCKILSPKLVDFEDDCAIVLPFGDGTDHILCLTAWPFANRVRLPLGLQFIVRLARRAIARKRCRLHTDVLFGRERTFQNRGAASRSRLVAAVCAPPSIA